MEDQFVVLQSIHIMKLPFQFKKMANTPCTLLVMTEDKINIPNSDILVVVKKVSIRCKRNSAAGW
ncbi:unnamed protein product [Ceutorhynchus assimilis]|uniref:Uncharacterized protein n=1 Tax=Ceutorhynchus assimilis TaxID=467358 RepID=A0A9N9MBT9_9CUCU|nr:unnamed protein product [Ceutorhynchus assimilis]